MQILWSVSLVLIMAKYLSEAEREDWAKEISNVTPLKKNIADIQIRKNKVTTVDKAPLAHNIELDLHGYTLQQAFDILHNTLEKARSHKVKNIRVITGKGGGEESMQKLLSKWLQNEKLAKHVISCDIASPKEGGSGAYNVKLKNYKL